MKPRVCRIEMAVMNTETGTVSHHQCGQPIFQGHIFPLCFAHIISLNQFMAVCPHQFSKGYAAIAAATARECVN